MAREAAGRLRIDLLSQSTVTLTQGSGCAPYSLAGRSVTHSTAMASLMVVLSGMMLATKEKEMAGGETFSSL